MDKKQVYDIGLYWDRGTPGNFIRGLIFGSVIFAAIIFILVNFTGLNFHLNPKGINQATALGFIAIVPLAFMEELAFRSYTFSTLYKKYGLWITQILVAIAYAAYHIATGWSVFSAFSGPFVWAFVFGLATAKSGGIALPAGIHIALNIWQPLVGMKGEEYSLWSLTYPDGTPSHVLAKTDMVGILIQACILLSAILLTALYTHKEKSYKQSYSV